jgi:hypothetical protein
MDGWQLAAYPEMRVRAAGVRGREQAMTDVFDEIHEDELTEAELDELEALGAAEDAELILARVEVGQIDA